MKISRIICMIASAAVILIAATSALSQWLMRDPGLARKVHLYEIQGVEKFAQPRIWDNYPEPESTQLRWQK